MTTLVGTTTPVVVQSLPERLRYLRTVAGLKPADLDKLAGLGRGHSRMVEAGERYRIEALTLANLAEVYGVSMDWLYRGLGEQPTEEAIREAVASAWIRGPKEKPHSAKRVSRRRGSAQFRKGARAKKRPNRRV